MFDQDKATRIRWNSEERDAFIKRGAEIYRAEPDLSDVDVLRKAMTVLPIYRRREVRAAQAFKQELQAIKKWPTISAVTQTPEPTPLPALDAPIVDSARSSSRIAMAKAVADLLALLSDDIKGEVSKQGEPTREAIREALTPIGERLDTLEENIREIAECCAWLARELGRPTGEQESPPRQPQEERSSLPQASPPHTEEVKAPQQRPQHVKKKPSWPKQSFRVVGVKGDQKEELTRLFRPFNVRLTFIEASKVPGIDHQSQNPTIVWLRFVGHNVQRFENQVATSGGIYALRELIREQAHIPRDLFYSKNPKTQKRQ